MSKVDSTDGTSFKISREVYHIFTNQHFSSILEQIFYLNCTQPPIRTNDLYSRHVNKSNKQTELLLLKFKTKKSPDMLGRCRYSERLIFIVLRNETTPPSRLGGFPGNKESGLSKYQLVGKCWRC